MIIEVSRTDNNIPIYQSQRAYENSSLRCFIKIDGKKKFLNKEDSEKVASGLLNIKLTTKSKKNACKC